MICPECGHRSGIHAFMPGQRVLYGPYPATVLRIAEESDQVEAHAGDLRATLRQAGDA